MGPSRTAELSMVSMTTAESCVVGRFSLPPRSAGWPTLLLPVNTSVSVNFGVTHPHNHLSRHAVTLPETSKSAGEAI